MPFVQWQLADFPLSFLPPCCFMLKHISLGSQQEMSHCQHLNPQVLSGPSNIQQLNCYRSAWTTESAHGFKISPLLKFTGNGDLLQVQLDSHISKLHCVSWQYFMELGFVCEIGNTRRFLAAKTSNHLHQSQGSLRNKCYTWYYAGNTFILLHLVFSLNKVTDKVHLQNHETWVDEDGNVQKQKSVTTCPTKQINNEKNCFVLKKNKMPA